MKKVKVLLSAVAVIAIVAASMASKARLQHVIYTENPAKPGVCDQQLPGFTLGNQTPTFATLVSGQPCKNIVVRPIAN